jgi:GcrA cell cycle regulator
LSGAAIGRELQLTKCQVIGKAHRLKLAGRPSPLKAPSAKLQKPKTETANRIIKPKKFKPLPAPKPAPVQAPIPTAPVPFIDLQPGQCCWPIGEPRAPGFGACGRVVGENGASYCAAHMEAAVSPMRKW